MLCEFNWFEASPLIRALRKHAGKNRWVHFSDIDKMGINPHKKHRDPNGVYFYPVDWILSEKDGDGHQITYGSLYGLNKEYFFVAEINPVDQLYLPGMTKKLATQIAKKNGWWDALSLSSSFQNSPKENIPYQFWKFVSAYVNQGRGTWGQVLKGYKSILDNEGLIHPSEESQICAIDPRVIKLVDKGYIPYIDEHKEYFSYWKTTIMKICENVAKKYDGTLSWMDKTPRVKFMYHDAEMTLVVTPFGDFHLHTLDGGDHKLDKMMIDLYDDDMEDVMDQIDMTIGEALSQKAA